MKRNLIGFLGALGFLGCTFFAYAQEYPSRPITLIAPAAAGGTTDLLSRLVAGEMGKALKQSVVVENVGGAGTTIGGARAARSPGDGYTLLFNNMGQAIIATMYRQLPYNVITDFEPIGLIADLPQTLVARKTLPAKDFQEMLAYIKTNKEQATWANAGVGSTTYLCGMLFMTAIGTDLTTISYRGTGPALIDLIAGRVDFSCGMAPATLGYIKAGAIKVYGVTSKTRVPSLPDTPTLNEAGLPGFEMVIWHGLWAPKGTPPGVINKLSIALQQALKGDLLKKRLAEFGATPVPQDQATPEALRTRLKAEVDKWAPIIKKAGVYAN